MKATRLEFRFRVAIICTLYFVGFFAPWERFGAAADSNPVRLWSWLAITLARSGLASVNAAYMLVTVIAVALAIAGAWLRLWGTAYLGHFVMRNPAMQAGAVMASGPYRHLRNPLYVGMLLNSIAVAVLMPASGALFFLVGMTVLTIRLIGAEEVFLSAQLGEPYAQYLKTVPSIWPDLRPQLIASPARARWLQGLLAEIYPTGTAICFLVLAWSYEADLLARCVLVCFGLSLVVRALTGSEGPRVAPAS